MKRLIFILLLLVLPLGLKSTGNINNKTNLTTIQNGQWVQLWDYKQTNPSCQYNCISVWYTLWRFSMPDEYGYYQYCYVFQSNSKYNNGYLANTAMYGTTIVVNNIPVTYLDYGVAGNSGQTQLSIYFKIHYNYTNSSINWITKQMALQ